MWPQQRSLENIEKDTLIIREWITKQAHLPQKIEDNFIRRFLHCCEYSLERTKSLIDSFFTIRSQTPELFANRDPENAVLRDMFELMDVIPLPKKNEKNYKLFLYRLSSSDVDRYFQAESLKAFFMIADLRLLFESELVDGEVPIIDLGNLTLRHFTKLSLPITKKYMIYTQEAHPVRMKQIHLINVPPFLDRCLAMVKPFMNTEVAQALQFHQRDSTTLYDYVSKDLLPEDYGGSLPKMEILKAEWMKKLQLHKDVFLDEARWKIDESKRPAGSNNNTQNLGLQGSFRSLNID